MEKREICSCGAAGGWAKVIVWLQIVLLVLVFNTMTLIVCVIGLSYIMQLGQEGFKNVVNVKDTVLRTAEDSAYAIAVTILVITVAAVSLSIGYRTVASTPHSITNGFKNSLAVATTTEVSSKEAETVKELIKDPSEFAAVAAPTIFKKPVDREVEFKNWNSYFPAK